MMTLTIARTGPFGGNLGKQRLGQPPQTSRSRLSLCRSVGTIINIGPSQKPLQLFIVLLNLLHGTLTTFLVSREPESLYQGACRASFLDQRFESFEFHEEYHRRQLQPCQRNPE